MTAEGGGMRAWVRQWRVYLLLLPLLLALGFGSDVLYAVEQLRWPQALDVPAGEVVRYQGYSFQLTSLTVEQPAEGETPPANAVVVVARFRGRVDDLGRAERSQCFSFVENRDGLEWRNRLSAAGIPKDGGYSCDGLRFTEDGNRVRAGAGEWYEFRYDYWVREERAVGLRPVIWFHAATSLVPYRRELRFAT